MLKKFFVPYEEYTLHTTLPPEELRPGLERSCPRLFTAEFFAQRLRGWSTSGGEPELAISRRDPIRLIPTSGTRNFMRGTAELLPLAGDAKGTKLQVTIRPADCRWFVLVVALFSTLWSVAAAIRGAWWNLLVCPATLVFLWLLLFACRELAKSHLPALKAALANQFRRLEAEKMSLNYDTADAFRPYRGQPPRR